MPVARTCFMHAQSWPPIFHPYCLDNYTTPAAFTLPVHDLSPSCTRPFAFLSRYLKRHRFSHSSLVLDASPLLPLPLSLQTQQSSGIFLCGSAIQFLNSMFVMSLFTAISCHFTLIFFRILESWVRNWRERLPPWARSCSLGLFYLNSLECTLLLPGVSNVGALLARPCSPRFPCILKLIVFIFFCKQCQTWTHHMDRSTTRDKSSPYRKFIKNAIHGSLSMNLQPYALLNYWLGGVAYV